ncbi:MAG: prenyltransferase [Coriobacteriales bacterium]
MSTTPWVQETRPQFLLLAVLLVFHASALAAWQGSVDIVHSLIAAVALVLLHASVNVLNDWHDFSKTEIDKHAPHTPFSGGSGLLPQGRVTPSQALGLGIGLLIAGCALGLYLAWSAGWPLLVIGVAGAMLVVTYTPFLNKIGLGEVGAGLGLGVLPVVGTYFLLTGRFDAVAWVSSIPAGLLTYNLLLLNEFPDAEADAAGGRRHMVTLLGKQGARWLYAAVEASVYLTIIVAVAARLLTPWALLGLGSAPFAVRAVRAAIADYASFEKIVPAQGANVMAVLATNALLGIGYVIAALV